VKLCPLCATEYADGTRFCPNDGQTLRASSPAADLVGQVVADRYHIVRKLGEGGMGQVYLAEHVKMGRQSAIKVMNPAMVHDADAVARFNREASNASRISHPNVCAIYDFGETSEGLIYLAMEYIDGVPLSTVLEREGALPVRRAAGLCLQVAEALQAAHDLGIVHRDLKPDNVMLTRGRSGQEIVKVVDFGIAKAVTGDAGGQKVTKTGLVIGTPEFMSPEQLAGDSVDGRSDLYSLALVLYRAITGRLPFEGDTVQETMVKRLTDEPRPLAQARPDLPFPAGLQACLDQALARMPGQRYQSVAKFAHDLAGAAGITRAGAEAPMPPTRADAEGKTEPLDTAMRRQVAGGTRSAAAPPRPSPPRRPRRLVPLVVGAMVVLGGGAASLALLNGGNHATRGVAPVDSSGGQTTSVAGGRQGNGGPRPVTDTQRTQPVDTGPSPGIPLTAVPDLLGRLIEMPPRVIVDSATMVYHMSGVARAERAFAACLNADAQRSLGASAEALRWARLGLDLNPGLASCRAVVSDLSGQP
jgi:serine/threonine-protein kinase